MILRWPCGRAGPAPRCRRGSVERSPPRRASGRSKRPSRLSPFATPGSPCPCRPHRRTAPRVLRGRQGGRGCIRRDAPGNLPGARRRTAAARLADLNAKVMRKIGKSRAELLETLDRPALDALPAEPYRYAEWKKCLVAPDYHVEAIDRAMAEVGAPAGSPVLVSQVG